MSSDSPPQPIRIGSRGSDLALWQARHVAHRLQGDAEIVIIKTKGDQIQNVSLHKVEGKGFFTKEIESALLSSKVDTAVHSYKDLPTEDTPGLRIAAVSERAAAHDVLIMRADCQSNEHALSIKPAARIGTSSLRRQAQLRAARADLMLQDIRGNVATRIGKIAEGLVDGVVLAQAGIDRLELWESLREQGLSWHIFKPSELCPAPAQGALAIQIRSGDQRSAHALRPLHDPLTAQCVQAERLLLSRFGGGCHLPLGAFCSASPAGELHLQASVTAPDGSHQCIASSTGLEPSALAAEAHQQLCAQGAEKYL